MQYVPSLLEYSPESLQKKIDSILTNTSNYYEITHQKVGHLHLHLDFVSKYFAQDRKVMESLHPKAVLESIEKGFGEMKLFLSIHLMGNTEDLVEIFKFFETYKFVSSYHYTILVPAKFYKTWSDKFQSLDCVEIGIWLDRDEWNTFRYMPKISYLLMTVLAGKSGQKLSKNKMTLAMNTVKTHPDSTFFVDGGWAINFESKYDNLYIVSHSSFWNKFNETK